MESTLTVPSNAKATAFISCSLRDEDKAFLERVTNILSKYDIHPIGTVGKYSAAPTNVAIHMKENIPAADMVVIAATPRYLSQDLHNGNTKHSLSEMIHVEAGLAYASDKPVLVFVKEGTDVGSFIPQITQYITIKDDVDVETKALINSLLMNALKKVIELKNSVDGKKVTNFFLIVFAIYGFYKFLQYLFSKD